MSPPTELDTASSQQSQSKSVLTRLGGLTGLRTGLVDFLVIALTFCFIILLTVEVSKNSIVVQPISVPDEYRSNGYTPEVVSKQLITRIQDVYRRAYSGRTGDDLLAVWTQPDVHLPGAGVSMRTIGTYLRSISGRSQTEVSGAIVRDGTQPNKLLLQVSRTGSPSAQISVIDHSIDNMLGKAAEKAVQILDRTLYGLYKLSTNSPDRMEEIRSILMSADAQQDAWMHYYQGVIAADKGHTATAIASFRAANVIDATNDWGVVLFEKSMFRASIEKYKTAISIAPLNPLLRVNLADAFIAIRAYDVAEKELIRAMNLDPDFLTAQLLYAALLYSTGREDEGQRKFATLVQQHPTNYEIRLYWAAAQAASNRWNDAVNNYREARKLNWANEEVLTGLGSALAATGAMEEAAAVFSEAAKQYPRSWRVLRSWGNSLFYGSDTQAAEEKFRAGTVVAPDNVFLLIDLANALRAQGKHDEAMSALEKALKGDEELPTAYHLWGVSLYEQGDYAAAVDQYRKAVKLAPDDAVIRTDLADALRAAGRLEEARVAITDVLKIDPNSAQAHNVWGHVLYEQEDYAVAAEQYRKALKLAPDDAVIRANLADALSKLAATLLEQKDYVAVADQYREAVELAPDDATMQANLDRVIQQLDK